MVSMKSGVTAFEARTLAREYSDRSNVNVLDIHGPYRRAILAEALELLAEKLEAERRERGEA
jgi:hypothetical protein